MPKRGPSPEGLGIGGNNNNLNPIQSPVMPFGGFKHSPRPHFSASVSNLDVRAPSPSGASVMSTIPDDDLNDSFTEDPYEMIETNSLRERLRASKGVRFEPWTLVGRAVPSLIAPVRHNARVDMQSLAATVEALRYPWSDEEVEEATELEMLFAHDCQAFALRNALDALTHPFLTTYADLSWSCLIQ